jgi:hypothetical protein
MPAAHSAFEFDGDIDHFVDEDAQAVYSSSSRFRSVVDPDSGSELGVFLVLSILNFSKFTSAARRPDESHRPRQLAVQFRCLASRTVFIRERGRR